MKKFDENHLTFLYQDQTSEGKESRFSKLVIREKESQTSEESHKGR